MSNITQINDQFINAATASFVNGNIFTSTNPALTASYALTASLAPDYVLISSTSSMLIPYLLVSFTSSMLQPYVLTSQTSSMLVGTSSLALTASGSLTGSLLGTASWASNSLTSSYLNTLSQDLVISGNLSISGNLNVFGTASYTYVTASQLDVGTNTISVNVAEPAERFGGLLVYDSGSLSHQATASMLWDSLNNHWVYQNASGSTYSGGMLMSGPRNTGSLGDEPSLTKRFIARSDGGDHLNNTQIYSSESVHIVTGSLTVTEYITGSFTGSLQGTASWADSASNAINSQTASFLPLGTYQITSSWAGSASQAITASYITGAAFTSTNPALSASYALTASYAMNGGGGGGGTSLGLVYAVSVGYLMP